MFRPLVDFRTEGIHTEIFAAVQVLLNHRDSGGGLETGGSTTSQTRLLQPRTIFKVDIIEKEVN